MPDEKTNSSHNKKFTRICGKHCMCLHEKLTIHSIIEVITLSKPVNLKIYTQIVRKYKLKQFPSDYIKAGTAFRFQLPFQTSKCSHY